MTNTLSESEDLAHADATVARAYKALGVAVVLLESALDAARAAHAAGEGDTSEVVKELRAVGAAFQMALQLEVKAREAGSQRYTRHGTGVLDLAAARREIEGRLARLRATREGGTVPEQLE